MHWRKSEPWSHTRARKPVLQEAPEVVRITTTLTRMTLLDVESDCPARIPMSAVNEESSHRQGISHDRTMSPRRRALDRTAISDRHFGRG